MRHLILRLAIIEKHKNKLNNKTENYLKGLKDKKEEKDFIVKFTNSINETKLANFKSGKKIERFKLNKIKVMGGQYE